MAVKSIEIYAKQYLEREIRTVETFMQLLNKYLTLQTDISRKDKLDIIKLLDKMNLQRELLELQKNELNISHIRTEGKRLGRKAQSAFSAE